MVSIWDKKQCPLCFDGTLHYREQKQTREYRGHKFECTVKGAFCDKCSDGFPEYGENEKAAFAAFRHNIDEILDKASQEPVQNE